MEKQKKYYYCIGKKWRDKINGNTYFNAKVVDADNKTIFYTGFQYGYGNAYFYEAKRKLAQIIDPCGYDANNWVLIDIACSYDLKKVLKNNDF